jgi:signal transduction histidine kinase
MCLPGEPKGTTTDVPDTQMETTDLVHRLAEHKTLAPAPRDELAWLASHGSIRQLSTGDVLTAKGAKVAGLFVLLSGRIAIFVDRGAGLKKVTEWRAGEVIGLLPYSRLVSPPGDTIAQEPTEILQLPRECLREMTRECYEVTSILVHSMIDRVRVFNSSELHDEKMVSLGRLSAGLAHELNNPASAIERSAALLKRGLDDSEQAARELGSARLTESQLAVIDGVRDACASTTGRGVLSPIEEAEREDAIADWLSDHALDTALSEALADTALSFEALNQLASAVHGPLLNTVLRWAAAGYTVRGLASEIQDASTRISELVQAVKGFTHMDQATVAEPVDLLKGLSDTVAVLKPKARAKSTAVVIDVEPGLPRVLGFAGELNQIWVNLIDNALDAVPSSGRVEVLAERDGRRVIVRVIDNGSGIAPEIRDRIFDPFFTTKPMGQGTGLGLDIVRRLVRHNDGEIAVDSQPGRTEFRVLLSPVETSGALATR